MITFMVGLDNNIIMMGKGTALTFLVIIGLIIAGALFILIPFAQSGSQETGAYVMNVSLVQGIGIVLSTNLTTGIFFTNNTGATTNVQYPLTNPLILWNASGNFAGGVAGSYNTTYNVTAPSTNTVAMIACQCVCGNMTCNASSGCVPTDNMWIYAAGGNEGVQFLNMSNSSSGWGLNVPYTTMYDFGNATNGGIKFYQPINASMPAGVENAVWLRYWLDPYPNTTSSGVYNTTYKFMGRDASLGCQSTCTC